MKEMFVFTLITGKIIEENPQFLIIQKICAKTGIQKVSLPLIKMVANRNTDVPIVMVGRNKNFIQTTSKLSNVFMGINVRNHIALITIMKMIESINFNTGLNTSLKLELFHSQLTSM
jgi:hypothetical protein